MDDAGVLRLARGASGMLRRPLELLDQLVGRGRVQLAGTTPPPAQRPVIGRMPEGVPPAALRPEPSLPAPVDWPFAESFPRTCGTGRLDAGAAYWTDFLYDDHGATGIPDVTLEPLALTIPRGTYTYRKGPAAGNGADLFRAAVGLDTTFTWWRVDWNTLVDPSVPIAAWALGVDQAEDEVREWGAGTGIRSTGVDHVLLVSGTGAWLIDVVGGGRQPVTSVGGMHDVDLAARSFTVRLPRAALDPTGSWKVRLAAGLATESGDGFAPVDEDQHALPGQPAVYNVAFRTYQQEAPHLNFWMDRAQAEALSAGDVSAFALDVEWADLAAGRTTPEPLPTGLTNRWLVSNLDLGQGVGAHPVFDTEPFFLGRVQPYAVYVPSTYDKAQPAPVTLLLHSLGLQHNQFGSLDPRFLGQVAEDRGSISAMPLGRGPTGWYFDEAELDFWEVWARIADAYNVDPDRTVVGGYSMGGYGAYKLALGYPEAFSKSVVLAGPPTCGVRLVPGLDIPGTLDPDSHCAREGETFRLLVNARWLPFFVGHGALDEVVPVGSVLEQVAELDRLGYRYRFELYPVEDHIGWAVQDAFASAAAHMGTDPRQEDPGHITFAWYPALLRADLGIGPARAWWVQDLEGRDAGPGVLAEVDARSLARPDPTTVAHLHGSLELHGGPTPGVVAEQTWEARPPPRRHPELGLRLRNTAALAIDVGRAGFLAGEPGAVHVATDGATALTLRGLEPGTTVLLDGGGAGAVGADGAVTIAVPKGLHAVQF
ncbi:MAG TPA: alpha/beta hydrolase-fold protein [Acidimicrobiales bacterium]|nr:alpha/beta hydrolase-fold protein [Acidimicrobiales bacterium]